MLLISQGRLAYHINKEINIDINILQKHDETMRFNYKVWMKTPLKSFNGDLLPFLAIFLSSLLLFFNLMKVLMVG